MKTKAILLHPRSAALVGVVFAMLALIGAGVTLSRTSQPVSVVWEPLSGPVRSFVWEIARHPDHPEWLYAGTNGGGVYLSRDNGATWEQKARGLTSSTGETQGIEPALYARDILFIRPYEKVVTCLATWGGGIYCSEDDGELWKPQIDITVNDQTLISASMHVRVLAETQQDMFAGTKAGVLRLVDLADGFWEPAGLEGKDVRALLVHPLDPWTLYAATWGDGIHKLTYQEGEFAWAWEAKNNGLVDGDALIVNALLFDPADPDVLYAGTFERGVYRSDDAGESWDAWADGLPDQADVWSLVCASDGTVFAGLRYGGTHKRAPGAEAWQKAEFPYGALTLLADGDVLYAGTWGVEHDGVVSGGLFRNATGRDTSPEAWANLGLPPDSFDLQAALFVGRDPAALYVGTLDDGVYTSDDAGIHWQRRNRGLEGASLTVWALTNTPDEQTLYAGTGGGVFSTTDAGVQWQPLGENSPPNAIAVVVTPAQTGGEVVYAGTVKEGLWVYERATWTGPQAFAYRADAVLTKARVPALLTVDERVYASVLNSGIHIGPAQTWPVVETPQYIENLALAEKTLLQWGGKQFYATTERGLYGSDDGVVWASLPLTSVKTIAVDPRHPQVVFAGLLPTFAAAPGDAASPVTPTSAIMVSLNDGRTWRGVGALPDYVTRLIRSPESPHLFALVTGGGLYRGTVSLPWLWAEVLWGWLIGVCAYGVLVVVPFSYVRLRCCYDLSHAGVRRLLAHPGLLGKLRGGRFKRDLKPLDMLILATMERPQFSLVDVWARFDAIGVPTSRARLLLALDTLVDAGILRKAGNLYAYPTVELQRVAVHEYRPSADALITDMRREDRLFNDIEAFFDEAEFDVRQDAPALMTKFALYPRRALYDPYGCMYAWLRVEGALQAEDVDAICAEMTAAAPASGLIPIGFFVVTEQPTVEAWLRIRAWRERARLIPLSITTLRSALRERSSMRDVDRLVQQGHRVTDLYDVRTPVIDWLGFFGRQDALAAVERALDAGRSVSVCGIPAVGKSSLLWHLKAALVNPLVAYADVLHGSKEADALQRQIIDDLARDVWLKYRRRVSIVAATDFAAQVAALVALTPADKAEQARVVVLVDGVTTRSMPIFESLMADIVNIPGVCIVTAWQDATAVDADGVQLTGLSEAESAQLMAIVGAQVGFECTADSLALIYRETGGHPNLLRQLGSLLVQRWIIDADAESARITVEAVAEIMPAYQELRARYFAQLWRWLPPEQRAGLQQWAVLPAAERAGGPWWVQPSSAFGDLFATWISTSEESPYGIPHQQA